MSIYYGDNGTNYVLTDKIGGGGVGTIYRIQGDQAHVAKIFLKREKQRDTKVKALRQLKWSDEIKRYVALPQVILYEDKEKSKQCGYVMENVDCSTLLTDTFIGDRPLSIRRRAIVGLNICKVLRAIHEESGGKKGQLLMGDFNFNNIAVNRYNGEIRIIDTDSFHLKVRTEGSSNYQTLPCTELYPDLFMPEILCLQSKYKGATLEQLSNSGAKAKDPKDRFETFTLYTDYYCLAYHLHLLLLNCAPFSCALPAAIVGKASQFVPPPNMLKMNGNYCYSNLYNDNVKKTVLPEYCPDFGILTPNLQNLFIRAFEKGARQPELRPSPDEFISALSEYIESLDFCECDGWNHYLRDGYNSMYCEWCRVEKVAGSFSEFPKRLEDIQYMTDMELMACSRKAKARNNSNVRDYVTHELSYRYHHKGHNGESRLKANVIKKLFVDICAKIAEKKHEGLKITK